MAVTDIPGTGTTKLTGGGYDLRAYAINRASTLLSVANPVVALEESFAAKPGQTSSYFTTAEGTVADVTTKNGGWKSLSTAGSGGTSAAFYNGQNGGMVSNVGTQKWYMLYKFAVSTAVDAVTRVAIGFIDVGQSADQPTFGVRGASSTTKFRFTDQTAGVNSTIDIDTAVHTAEMWCTGTGVIYGSIDGETPVSYTTAKTAACQAYAQVLEGATAAVRTAQFGHCIYITD
jgi:hypothetical protein